MTSRAIRCGLLDKGNRRRDPQSPINEKQLDPYVFKLPEALSYSAIQTKGYYLTERVFILCPFQHLSYIQVNIDLRSTNTYSSYLGGMRVVLFRGLKA